jgi:hypothetical protein
MILIPVLSFSKGYYPKKSDIFRENNITVNPDNFCEKIKNAPSNTTIILSKGTYKSGCQIKNKKDITIIAEKPKSVVFKGDTYGFEIVNSEYINILNLNFIGSGIVKIPGYTTTTHHIYLGGIYEDGGMVNSGIFTGPNSHDITLDNSILLNQNGGEYNWYALGWHLSVTNSFFDGIRDNSIIIRGYHPLNRLTEWDWKTRDPIRKNIDKYKQLPKDEWTHYIANNEFGSSKPNRKDKSRGAQIGFYNAWGNKYDLDDEQYFPPQNVVIENNVFHNTTDLGIKGSIWINENYGFPKGANTKSVSYNKKPVIRGTIIRDNYSDQSILRVLENANQSLIKTYRNKTNMNNSELKVIGKKIRNLNKK